MFDQNYNEQTRPAYFRGMLSAGEIAQFILERDQPNVRSLPLG